MTWFTNQPAKDAATHVFETLRNALVCAALAAAGLSVARHPELSPFGVGSAFWVSLVVVLISSLLLIWNILIGASKLLEPTSVRSLRFWLFEAPMFAVVFCLLFAMWGAVAKLQSGAFPVGGSVTSSAPSAK